MLVPSATVYRWLNEQVNGEPLVRGVRPKRGWPCLPFIAVVEAYVLRSLRDLGLTKGQMCDAAADVHREFDTPYGLATDRIANDGVDILVRHANDDIRKGIGDCLKYITWDEVDGSPSR
ncbi:MAG TPA: hypothetical protein VHZ97_25920 [Pseudonocardiaceae bacterium]|nr:hypothetical protein [Pseudonocardiaceae bacterium]